MENKRPLHWWEEFLGLNFTKKSVARKVWKSYLGYVAAIPLCITNTPLNCQARPDEVDLHTPSQSQHAAEPMRTLMVATTSTGSFNVSDNFIYRIVEKEKPK